MLRHLIHLGLPSILSGFETVIAFQILDSTFIILSTTGFLGGSSSLTGPFIRLAEFNIC